MRLYADDTTACLSDVFPTILEFSFNKDLQTLSSWFESNHLTVNSTKTQALSVGPCACHYSLFLCNFETLFDFQQNTNNDKTRQLHKSK